MFQVSRQVDYAIQLIRALDGADDPLSLQRFAGESNISFLFLQKIAKQLRNAGMVQSTRGAKGGYTLARDPKQISVKEVIEAIEGQYGVVDCQIDESLCDKVAVCQTRELWGKVNEQMIETLSKTYVVS